MTPKEIRAREVIAHPERFDEESAELKAYKATENRTDEGRVEAIVAILSGLNPSEKVMIEEVEEVEETTTPKKKGRPTKKKK